jgi:hypothetical protein
MRHRDILAGTVLVLLALNAGAPAAPSRAGAWKETGTMTDAGGKQTACVAGFCGGLAAPNAPDLSTICALADALAGYAEQQLTQVAEMMRRQDTNCLDGDEAHFDNAQMRAFVCDHVALTLGVFQKDDRHLSYSITTEKVDREHPAPPPWPRMVRESIFEWLGADCSKTNGAIRPR